MDTDRAMIPERPIQTERATEPHRTTLAETVQAVAEQVANHADALNRVGQRLSDAEQRIEELLREVGK